VNSGSLDGLSLIRFILDVHEIGGAVLDIDVLDRALASRHEVTLHKVYMTPRQVEGWTEMVGRSTISYHPIHYRKETIQQDRDVLVSRIRGTIQSLIERHQPDLVANHIPEIPTGLLVSRLAKENGIPLFIQFHGGEIPRMRFTPDHQVMVDGVARFLNESARLADVVTAVSDSAQRLVQGRKVVNLWTGADASVFDPARVKPGYLRDRFDVPGGLPIFLLPARIVVEKGHKILLDACQMLFERGHDLRVVFVGSATPETIRQMDGDILESGLSGVVHMILGATQDEMRFIYRDADLVVLPGYHFEGCPRCLLEGQLMEKPVVASDAGGTRESFVDGDTGILFPVGDTERLAHALETLLVDSSLRERMGRAGRRFVKERFGLESLALRHEAVYRSLMRQPVAVSA
jgi:glycosyltransferase involved in cell wall biosynthesis